MRYNKQRYFDRKNAGVCTYCGTEPPSLPRLTCDPCSEKIKANTNRKNKSWTYKLQLRCRLCQKRIDSKDLRREYCYVCRPPVKSKKEKDEEA